MHSAKKAEEEPPASIAKEIMEHLHVDQRRDETHMCIACISSHLVVQNIVCIGVPLEESYALGNGLALLGAREGLHARESRCALRALHAHDEAATMHEARTHESCTNGSRKSKMRRSSAGTPRTCHCRS